MTIYYPIDNKEFTDYLNSIEIKNTDILAKIIDYNDSHRMGQMMIEPLQMKLLCWLANLIQTKNYLEIGVFTGYSSTAMALSLPESASLYLCDVSVTYTNIAQKFWQQANVAHKMKLYLQPALITLQEFIEKGLTHFFDFILIDADKMLIKNYLEKIEPLLRKGGVVAIDNIYMKGKVALPQQSDDSLSLQAMRQFNQAIFKNKKFSPLILPLGDGLTLLMKR